MKERGKAVEAYDGNNSDFPDYNYYSSSSDFPCKKHPSSSSPGICAYCLKERLIKLVCSDCGEQRLSSCSCSDVSSYRNSSFTNVDVGSVGRISFLIENEKTEEAPQKKSDSEEGNINIILKRSNSTCCEVKRSNSNRMLWRIGRIFRRKREKDDKSEMWVSDYGVSRSRSLCSFRGGGFKHDPDQESSDYAFSSAKISDVNGGFVLDSGKPSGFSEGEARKLGFKGVLDLDPASGVPNGSVFPVKESDFGRMDESGFIDLKLDLASESKREFSVSETVGGPEFGDSFGRLKRERLFGNGGSCRITVDERSIKRGSKGYKVWRWILRHHPGRKSARKNEENSTFKTGN